MLKAGKSDNSQRKRNRMFMELVICSGLKSEIDHGLLGESAIYGIPAPDALNDSESELCLSRDIEYF